MSNYTQVAWHPKERVARAAFWIDDYFGHHKYGVRFEGDPHTYRPDEVDIPVDLVLSPSNGATISFPEETYINGIRYESGTYRITRIGGWSEPSF